LLLSSRVFSTDEVQQDVIPAAYATQADLVIPLVNNGIPLGFIIAGPRKSERSYTLKDIRLFSALSHRIVALFNTAELFRKDLDRQLYLERERSRIAEDMHDDLGASLTRISMLCELTMTGSEETEKKQQWLSQISETSRKVMQDLSQIIWALNPKNDSLEGLASYSAVLFTNFLNPWILNIPLTSPKKFTLTKSGLKHAGTSILS
jgi:signal transduction histidine kinase